MAYDYQKKYFCPRLLDYVMIVGSRNPNRNNSVAQTPELLRRYPLEDHRDFPLPPDVVFFCQPEGCISVGPKRLGLRETTSFVFTLTDKDSGKTRFGMCTNFYRPFERRVSSGSASTSPGADRGERGSAADRSTAAGPGQSSLRPPSVGGSDGGGGGGGDNSERAKSPRRANRKQKTLTRVRNNTLTSLCFISHHPFFSTFRECIDVLRRIIDACADRSGSRRIGGSKANTSARDSVWGVLTGQLTDSCPNLVMHEVREIDTWILRFLSAPVPVPGKTRVELTILPPEIHKSMVFAMPDHTRFSLVDFPLHLPLELLGVDTCLKVLTCIMLEHKIILQSRDYNALSMSVMAFVSMLYPLEYMFPIIPLLPTCMSSAEQLLLVPTPFIIGVPSSFLIYKKGFKLPDDVWLVDLDANKITPPEHGDEIPELPEPEGSVLKNHLRQALASMSMAPQPIKNLDTMAPQNLQNESWQRVDPVSNANNGFNPLIYGNDVDSVDIATRIAMVRFFNSPNTLGNFAEHTRTLRLYPRPVVAFQLNSFMKSRPVKSSFSAQLAKTQAVEYFVEWALNPTNAVFLRVQTGVYDPLLIGDKAKWFSHALQKIDFKVYAETGSTLGAALESFSEHARSNEDPTDESGSDSDGAESTSSSYSSLSDFVIDIQNSEINGDTPALHCEDQVLTVDEASVFQPPSQLQVPEDAPVSNSDSALSAPDSDDDDNSSDDNSSGAGGSPRYADEQLPLAEDQGTSVAGMAAMPPGVRNVRQQATEPEHFRYDPDSVASLKVPSSSSSNVVPSSKPSEMSSIRKDDSGANTPTKRDGLPDDLMHARLSPSSMKSSSGSPSDLRAETTSTDTSPMAIRRRQEAFQSRNSSSSSQSGKTPPQRPPPPSPAALGRTMSSDKSGVSNLSPSGGAVHVSAGEKLPVSPLALGTSPNSASKLQSAAAKPKPPPLQQSSQNLQEPKPAGSVPPLLKSPLGLLARGSATGSRDDDKGSIIDSLTGDLNVYAQSASNTISELFGDSMKQKLDNFSDTVTDNVRETGLKVKQTVEDMTTVGVDSFSETGSSKSTGTSVKSVRPFAPLGNRKALVEKSGLVKHASNASSVSSGSRRGRDSLPRQPSANEQRTTARSENQQFLKDVTTSILEGRGIGWLKLGRVKKLMEDENYRNFVVSRLNTSLEKKLSDESLHLEDVAVTKVVFKGMQQMIKALISGLEHTYQSQGAGGMASALMILEIIHTHYWEKEGSSKSDNSNQSLASSPFGSCESLSSAAADSKAESRSLHEEHMVAALGHAQGWQLEAPSLSRGGGLYASSSSSMTESGSPVIVNADDFETVVTVKGEGPEPGRGQRDIDNNVTNEPSAQSRTHSTNPQLQPPGGVPAGTGLLTDGARDSSGYASESGDMLRELVKNKELLETGGGWKKNLNKVGSVDSDVSDSSIMTSIARRKRSTGSFLSVKSTMSNGYRYREGRMLNVNYPVQENNRTYLFEGVAGKDRLGLWDQIQFWEDVFLDAVAQERDIIGMDQGPTEMMERYKSLNESEKKRLEHDEDRLLGTMLYNMVAFMVMMKVSKNEIRRKARRLLGKCHIGLACSQDINQLLDQINSLHGNDIDLKPLGSRLMQKQSFTVHWGADNTGDMLFMEVCDDCLILRSVSGAICDRWWYEKVVNMTYCPKTKVLGLWRKHNGKTQLNKFYTKKCKELYFCVKESMEKAAARHSGNVPGLELGSEFPVQDLKSGQGGLLQVCMEGIGLLFANSKLFIELCRIKKCFTQKGGIFVLEEFDPKTRKVMQRRYRSSMAPNITLAFHRALMINITKRNDIAKTELLKRVHGSFSFGDGSREDSDDVLSKPPQSPRYSIDNGMVIAAQ